MYLLCVHMCTVYLLDVVTDHSLRWSASWDDPSQRLLAYGQLRQLAQVGIQLFWSRFRCR